MTQNGHVGSQPPKKGSDDEDQKEDESEDENEEDSKLPAEGLGILSLDDNSVKSFRLAEWSACQSVDVKFPIEPANRPVPAVLPIGTTAVLLEYSATDRMVYCQLAKDVERAGGRALVLVADREMLSSMNTGVFIVSASSRNLTTSWATPRRHLGAASSSRRRAVVSAPRRRLGAAPSSRRRAVSSAPRRLVDAAPSRRRRAVSSAQ